MKTSLVCPCMAGRRQNLVLLSWPPYCNVAQVATLIAETFADMVFRAGDVHCDPHAANMLVRRVGGGGGSPGSPSIEEGGSTAQRVSATLDGSSAIEQQLRQRVRQGLDAVRTPAFISETRSSAILVCAEPSSALSTSGQAMKHASTMLLWGQPTQSLGVLVADKEMG